MRNILLVLGVLASTTFAFAENLYLLSFPRSGSHWTMYIIQYLTKKYWVKGTKKYVFPNLESVIDPRLSPNYRAHVVKYIKTLDPSNKACFNAHKGDKLIFILRNYRECFIRHCGYNSDLTTKKFQLNHLVKSYVDLITTYEKWDTDHRLLICYEDLMMRPEEEIARISKFLGADTTRLRDFVDHLDKHILASLNERKEASMSKGKDISYHSKNQDQHFLAKIDSEVESYSALYWDKYLKQYSLDESMEKASARH